MLGNLQQVVADSDNPISQQVAAKLFSVPWGFGGGKTHSLISLYHVVKDSRTFRDMAAASSILEPEDMPQFDTVFTQNTVSVVDGHQVDDSIITHILWGELTWQLGGREGYELVRRTDEQRIAPTAEVIKTVIKGTSPALILIDELADYCANASGLVVGGGTLFTQTNSFMQTLTEVVASISKTFFNMYATGLNVINRNGLMPTTEKPVKVNDFYEAFLRFDDKPMILNADAVKDTVDRYCEEGMWNVGTGEPEHYSRIYHNETIPFLNPLEDGYWLLDPSVMPPAGRRR